MAQIVDGYRQVITQGQYMGEEGTGYSWGTLPSYGDISHKTHGQYQGYTEPCRIEILVDGAELEPPANREGLFLFVPEGTIDKYGLSVNPRVGLDAQEAIERGLARAAEEPVTIDKEFLAQVEKDDTRLLTFKNKGQENYQECLSALESLLYRITHGGIKGNPYTKREVKRALQALAAAKGCEDWLNVPLNSGEE